jgi:hypothetical protein
MQSMEDSRASALRLGVVLIFALVLRLAFFVGYANVDPWDDTLYLELAQKVREGRLLEELDQQVSSLERGRVPTASAFVMRRGAYLPIAASQFFFGVSELSSALPSLVASLGTIALILLIGRWLESDSTGIFGALLYAMVPLDLILSSRILAEPLQVFWLTAAVAAAAGAARGTWRRSWRLTLYGFSGLFLYLSFFTKANALIGLPLLMAAVWPAFRNRQRRCEPLVLVLALGFLLLDGMLFFLLTGHPFLVFELEMAATRDLLAANPEIVFRPLPGIAVHCSYLEGLPHHYFKLFFGAVEHYSGLKLFSLHAPLGMAGLVYAFVYRRLGVLVIWLLTVFIYFQYGFRAIEWDSTTSVLHYYLNANPPRYLALLLPPLCLFGGSLLACVYRWKRSAAAVILVVIFVLGVNRSHENYLFYRGSMEDVREAIDFLLGQEAAPIYTDMWCRKQLPILSGGQLEKSHLLSRNALPSGAWVIVGGSRGFDIPVEVVTSSLPPPMAAVYLDPAKAPPNWDLSFRRSGRRQTSRASDLVVFRVK